jgi:hypothetical protein
VRKDKELCFYIERNIVYAIELKKRVKKSSEGNGGTHVVK